MLLPKHNPCNPEASSEHPHPEKWPLRTLDRFNMFLFYNRHNTKWTYLQACTENNHVVLLVHSCLTNQPTTKLLRARHEYGHTSQNVVHAHAHATIQQVRVVVQLYEVHISLYYTLYLPTDHIRKIMTMCTLLVAVQTNIYPPTYNWKDCKTAKLGSD